MIAPKYQAADGVWEDIKVQEENAKKPFRQRIDQLERVINLGKRALALRGQPGYLEFIKAVEDLLEAAQRQLVACHSSNDYMRIIQGRAQALGDVLAILSETEKTQQGLEVELESVKNQLEAITTGDGKVITEPLGANR